MKASTKYFRISEEIKKSLEQKIDTKQLVRELQEKALAKLAKLLVLQKNSRHLGDIGED